MKKRLSELIISWCVIGFFMFSLLAINARANTIFSLTNAKWFNYLLVFGLIMFFVGLAVAVGLVFGLQRGRGRTVERGDLVQGKPFKIQLVELVGGLGFSYVTIDVEGDSRLCKVYCKVPEGATHLEVYEGDRVPKFKFLEITPEARKTLLSC